MNRTQLLARLKEIEVIKNEKVTLRSGVVADYYCDIKKAFGYPDILNAIADVVIELVPPETTCIAASGYGGLPLGAVVASRSGKHFVSVRSSAKGYGLSDALSGYPVTENDSVTIVDDVLTSGSSIKETYAALLEYGVTPVHAIVFVARAEPELPLSYSSVLLINELRGL